MSPPQQNAFAASVLCTSNNESPKQVCLLNLRDRLSGPVYTGKAFSSKAQGYGLCPMNRAMEDDQRLKD